MNTFLSIMWRPGSPVSMGDTPVLNAYIGLSVMIYATGDGNVRARFFIKCLINRAVALV